MNHIYFEARHKDTYIEGYVCEEEIGEVDCPFNYIDELGNITEQQVIQGNPEHAEKLLEAFNEDDEVIQWLWDFKNENKTTERKGYTLIINDG